MVFYTHNAARRIAPLQLLLDILNVNFELDVTLTL